MYEKANPYQVQFPLTLIKMRSFHINVATNKGDQTLALKQLARSIRRIFRTQNHTKPIEMQTQTPK